MQTKTLENHAQGVFSLLFVRCFLLPGRARRGLALRRCPPSLFSRFSNRDGGCGDLSLGGSRMVGLALQNITRCWISLEVRVLAELRGTV